MEIDLLQQLSKLGFFVLVEILYLDGHVEFEKYPGSFPVTRAFATLVSLF